MNYTFSVLGLLKLRANGAKIVRNRDNFQSSNRDCYINCFTLSRAVLCIILLFGLRVPEGPFLKMPHTDGGGRSKLFLKFRPRSSSPENKIIRRFTGFLLQKNISKFLINTYYQVIKNYYTHIGLLYNTTYFKDNLLQTDVY